MGKPALVPIRIPAELAERVRPYAEADGVPIDTWVRRAVAQRLPVAITAAGDPDPDEVIAAAVAAMARRQP